MNKKKKEFVEENKIFDIENIFTRCNPSGIPINEKSSPQRIGDLPMHSVNPYRDDLIHSVKMGTRHSAVVGTDEAMAFVDTGEIFGKRVVIKQEVVDKNKFVKLYVDNIANMYGLPKYAFKLFQYILQNLPQMADEVYLYDKEIMQELGWSHVNQYHKALRKLTDLRFIAKTTRPMLWYINPTIFFNGDRVAFIRTIRKDNNEQGMLELKDGED